LKISENFVGQVFIDPLTEFAGLDERFLHFILHCGTGIAKAIPIGSGTDTIELSCSQLWTSRRVRPESLTYDSACAGPGRREFKPRLGSWRTLRGR
jgi:hypothetical protein